MPKKTLFAKHPILPYALGAVVVLVVVGSVYVYRTHHKKKPIATVNQYTKGEVNQSNNQPTNSQPNSSNNTADPPGSSKTGGTSASLVAPTGNFVSNHHPNLGGSPAPNTITSVCNTSPGASCQISFSSGSSTKSLPAQVTDAGGAAYWDWKLQDYGLTSGNWKISATSSLNGNSLSSTDPMDLAVSQ